MKHKNKKEKPKTSKHIPEKGNMRHEKMERMKKKCDKMHSCGCE